MPALFIGHGNPMNALEPEPYGRAWRALGAGLPRPRAVLSVSAHWFGPGAAVTAMDRPRTIHDFGGFPPALYRVQYPAPGAPALAAEVRELLAPDAEVALDQGWGLDHGTWSVLVHLLPAADVPVVQLRIDEQLTASQHVRLAARLRPLRDDGVLILGSGNLVHNLHTYAWGRHPIEPYDWAVGFETRVRGLIDARQLEAAARAGEELPEGHLAAPTPEHFLPLAYVLAQADAGDPVTFPVEGVDGGSVSMLSIQVG